MHRLRVFLLAGLMAVSTLTLAAPAAAQECNPDDGRGPCCKDYSQPVNDLSRRYTGQDVLLCPQ